MKSLRQLRDELIGVRLSPADQSIWNSGGATASTRARIALNDALNKFPCYIQNVYTSIGCTIHTQGLPREVEQVLRVDARQPSVYKEVPVLDYDLIPTPFTNLFRIKKIPTEVANTGYVEVQYLSRYPEFPEDGYSRHVMGTDYGYVDVSSNVDPRTWPSPGFLEISNDNTISREVVYYAAVTAVGFTNITRAIEGPAQEWPVGSRISPVAPLPLELTASIMLMAEASMYAYWQGHRATYSDFVTAARLNASDLTDVVSLVTMLERRAYDTYNRTKKLPPPSRIRSS